MIKYICDCCGGKINPQTMECEYCGTQFREDFLNDTVIRIETFKNPVETLKAAVVLPEEHVKAIGTEHASEFITKELSHKLSEGLAHYMVLENRFDPYRLVYVTSATVKVVVPKNGFEYWRVNNE